MNLTAAVTAAVLAAWATHHAIDHIVRRHA